MRKHATTILPIAGFVGMLILAGIDVGAAAGRPTAQLHALARQYAEALSTGDVAAAARFHTSPDPAALAGEIDARRGRSWWVREVRPESDGSYVTVLHWSVASTRGRGSTPEMSLAWRLEPGGWRIAP